MKLLDTVAVSYQIVFTKADKITDAEKFGLKKSFENISKKHPAMHPEYIICSSLNKEGMDDLKKEIESFI